MTSAVTLSRVHHNCVTTKNASHGSNSAVNYASSHASHYCNDIAITTLNCSDIGIDVTNYGVSMPSSTSQASEPSLSLASTAVPSLKSVITVPFGWKREVSDGRVLYYSPSDCAFASLSEIAVYLKSDGTCKCGLECPLIINRVFNFDPNVASKCYSVEDSNTNISTNYCHHKRKIIALATYKEHSEALIAQQQQQKPTKSGQQYQKQNEQSYCDHDYNYSVPHLQKSALLSVGNSGIEKFFSKGLAAIGDSVSVIHSNQNVDKLSADTVEGVINCSPPHNCHIIANNVQNYHNDQNSVVSPTYLRQTNTENECHYSMPLQAQQNTCVSTEPSHSMALQLHSSTAHIQAQPNSYCVYDSGHTAGMYSFSSCNSTQLSVQQNDKTSIYLTPQNGTNYGQVISYENANVNLMQPSQQAYTNETYSHHYNHSNSGCNASNISNISNIQNIQNIQNIHNIPLTGIPLLNSSQSYIPLHSPNTSNTGEISFNASTLSSTTLSLNSTYPSPGLHTTHNHSQHHSQNNISILPQNPPMPPLSVPNVTTVTTSVTDVIPAVGVGQQILNSGNTSGAPQVLQFINSVPLTQISANTVTVLQPPPSREVPSTTLLIPQIMPPHEHSVVINHAIAQQTAMFPHITTATSLTALPNAFQNIGIASTISLPQRNCVSDNSKPFTRSRKRKDYNRANRSHPPTVASILKQAADNEKKQKELNEKSQQFNSQTDDNEFIVDSSHNESNRSVAVQSELQIELQSELQSDSQNLVTNAYSNSKTEITKSFESDTECNDSFNTDLLTGDNIPVLQGIQIENNQDENPISDVSSEHSSPSSESFHGTGSDSGVESEPTGTPLCVNCDEPDSQQVVDTSRQRSLKRLKRLRKELSVYCGNDNSDDESPQSPPLPPQLRTFNIGDLVWGQMGDVRFWPGKLVGDDELVGRAIKREDGKLIVKWFGDHTFTQVEPENLKTLSEGLEEHHCARKRHRSGKRMNSFLEQAIQEAMQELDRQSNDITNSSAVLGVMTSTQTID